MSVGANKVLLLLVKISIYIWGDVRYNMYVIKGIQNRYLEIDLSRRTFKHGVPEEELFSEFLGGKGLGLKLMVDRGWVTQDPFAENNPLIVCAVFDNNRIAVFGRIDCILNIIEIRRPIIVDSDYCCLRS